VIKLFTTVIYCHFMVMLSFCIIKQHYLGNYCRMVVNYNGICVNNAKMVVIFFNLKSFFKVILTLEKVGLKLPL